MGLFGSPLSFGQGSVLQSGIPFLPSLVSQIKSLIVKGELITVTSVWNIGETGDKQIVKHSLTIIKCIKNL